MKMCKQNPKLPVFVATDDFSEETQGILRRQGCKAFADIQGSRGLKDWEGAAMDQFLMAEATHHFSMGCITMDTVGALYSGRIQLTHNSACKQLVW